MAADFQDPERVFGFFTVTAGLGVLGVRFAFAGHPLTTAILAAIAPAVWLLLTYAVPASILLNLPADIPVVRATTEFVSGFAFALWSFGTWWGSWTEALVPFRTPAFGVVDRAEQEGVALIRPAFRERKATPGSCRRGRRHD